MEKYLALKEDVSDWVFADQDFLNEYFKGCTLQLHYSYNTLKTMLKQHPDLWDLEVVRNIHYILEKPWNDPDFTCEMQKDYREINEIWWKVYKDDT